jgi:hypothetical protein
MGWSIGYDNNWKRDVGYGVPCLCDHPDCLEEIDRGLSHVCGGDVYGGSSGCGLFFCGRHLFMHVRLPQLCERCSKRRLPFQPKPDIAEWIRWKLDDESWAQWRAENPEHVAVMQQRITATLSSKE